MTILGTSLSVHSRRRGGSGAAPFSPTSLAGLRLALLSESGTTTPIDDNVSVWADTFSGVGLSLTQGTDANRPSLIPNQLDGFPGVRFGVTQTLSSGPTLGDVISGASYTIFIVGLFSALTGDNAGPTAYANSCFCVDPSGYFSIGARTTGPTLQVYNYDGDDDVAVSTSAIATATYALVQARHAGGQLFARWANQAEGTGVAANDTQAAGLSQLFQLGNANFAGDIVSIFAFNTALSGGDITSMRNWIAAKYPSLAV